MKASATGDHPGLFDTPPLRRLGSRYSRFVSLMKILLPLIAAALVLLVVAWPQTPSEDNSFRVSLAAIPEGDAGEPGMTRARFVGTDAKDQPFVITADAAVPLPGSTDRIKLTALQADITVSGGTWVSMMSGEGLYDRTGQQLALLEGVDLFADSGFEMHTAAADIDLAHGVARGDSYVTAHGPLGTLSADSFILEQDGRRLFFRGNVRMTVWPGVR